MFLVGFVAVLINTSTSTHHLHWVIQREACADFLPLHTLCSRGSLIHHPARTVLSQQCFQRRQQRLLRLSDAVHTHRSKARQVVFYVGVGSSCLAVLPRHDASNACLKTDRAKIKLHPYEKCISMNSLTENVHVSADRSWKIFCQYSVKVVVPFMHILHEERQYDSCHLYHVLSEGSWRNRTECLTHTTLSFSNAAFFRSSVKNYKRGSFPVSVLLVRVPVCRHESCRFFSLQKLGVRRVTSHYRKKIKIKRGFVQ